MLHSSALIGFHSIIKDLNDQLKQLFTQQKNNGTLKLPLTVFRGQSEMGKDEVEKITKEIHPGDLISMNSFLSTSKYCAVATNFFIGADKNTCILFQITINDVGNDERLQRFADISSHAEIKDEGEVLFGMSSVFKVTDVYFNYSYWVIEMELTNCEEDKDVQNLRQDIETYLYQVYTKQMSLIIVKQLLMIDTKSHPRPLAELMKFILIDMAEIFIVNAYKKNGRLTNIIAKEPVLQALITQSNDHMNYSRETYLVLLFDILNDFLYSNNNDEQGNRFLNHDHDAKLLLGFGGFLLITGDYQKSTQYFEMVLKHESIDDKLKIFINAILSMCHALNNEQELASKYFYDAFQSATLSSIQPWHAAFIVSSQATIHGSNPQINRILEPLMNREQNDSSIHEALRLLNLGQLYATQHKLSDALNCWEEAIEINSYLPSSALTIFNGVIYVLMAAAYLRLSNARVALHFMDKAIVCMKKYYPSSHRMFASLDFMRGYYLLQNENLSEAIEYFQKALNNLHFSNNQEFCGAVYVLLSLSFIQCGDIKLADEYCRKALKCPLSTEMNWVAHSLSEGMPEITSVLQYASPEIAREFVRIGLKFSQLFLSNLNSNIFPESINEETCTPDELISLADHYRHRQECTTAEVYYKKAIEKMTESNENLWGVYRKMIRMNYDRDLYRDYFIEQYSNYDVDNAKHWKTIATLQMIIYKIFLSGNESEFAFDFLILSSLTTVKSLYQDMMIDAELISKFLDELVHNVQFSEFIFLLTKLIEVHYNDWITHIKDFLSNFIDSNDLISIIHHCQIDETLSKMKLKYESNESSKCIFRFLDTILRLFRRCGTPSSVISLSFRDQILQFIKKYHDESTSLFYLVKILESLLMTNTQDFFHNLDQFQQNVMTYERYEKFKEKLYELVGKIEEDQLLKWLKNIFNDQ
ncbi:unnamed protein product [Rotaria magnacalcarata]